ncbi:MAG: HAD family phosphatase [Mycoplasma sp.]|nr:HAD family phosphatase [Candidatus Hennigella equi]
MAVKAKKKRLPTHVLHRRINKRLAKVKFDKRCLICTDLDGTLLNKDCYIRTYSREVINALNKKGHIVCLFTARALRGSYAYYRQLRLKTPIVNYNGSIIQNPTNPAFTPICFYINTEVIYKIFAQPKIQDLILNVIFETPDGTFFLKDYRKKVSHEQVKKELAKFNIYTNKDIGFVSDDFAKLKNGAYSILIELRDMSKAKIVEEEIKKICSSVIVRSWTEEHVGTIIEINSTFPSKGLALRYLSVYYDIPLERCYAFGDNDNDKEMLSIAGHGYAMKNGVEVAKKAAKHITKYDNHEQGVARELNRIFNLGIQLEINKNLQFEDGKTAKAKITK